MVVVMPPTNVARPIGNSMPDELVLFLSETLIKIGSNNTTTGVLFIKALKPPPRISVNSKERAGFIFQSLAKYLPIGSNAPVSTMP